ncbi:MAG: DUF86 domain-containing protein [Bauldia sp.]|nr:MAG: DUF86 domain-containing protein [Bauldia sp.]MBZ0229585.1 DUF86 domain-containing protein [Bauldia sp.]
MTRSVYSKAVHHALLAIRENIVLARIFVSGFTSESFVADRRATYAVTRCLEIISEASRRLTDEVTARHPHVPWRQIMAAGNYYRHDYDNVSPQMLWATVEDALHELDLAVSAEIEATEKLNSDASGSDPGP